MRRTLPTCSATCGRSRPSAGPKPSGATFRTRNETATDANPSRSRRGPLVAGGERRAGRSATRSCLIVGVTTCRRHLSTGGLLVVLTYLRDLGSPVRRTDPTVGRAGQVQRARSGSREVLHRDERYRTPDAARHRLDGGPVSTACELRVQPGRHRHHRPGPACRPARPSACSGRAAPARARSCTCCCASTTSTRAGPARRCRRARPDPHSLRGRIAFVPQDRGSSTPRSPRTSRRRPGAPGTTSTPRVPPWWTNSCRPAPDTTPAGEARRGSPVGSAAASPWPAPRSRAPDRAARRADRVAGPGVGRGRPARDPRATGGRTDSDRSTHDPRVRAARTG